MSWQHVWGHDALIDQFRRCVQRGRLASTFLFVGPAGIGKRTFALKLAQALLCERHPEQLLDPCGQCPSCVQVAAESHPDLELVAKPPDKAFIPLETFIGDREHRGREGLCHKIAMKPYRSGEGGGRKVAIIDDADALNTEGANCLLKTLEEPPPRSVIILIGTSQQRQLPTIRSRSQIIRFAPLAVEIVERLLADHRLVEEPRDIPLLARLSGGSLSRAAQLALPEAREFRRTLVESLTGRTLDSVALASLVESYVEDVGKDAPQRRARLREVIGLATELFRQVMRGLAGVATPGDDLLADAVEASRRLALYDVESAAACVDCCEDALLQVAANANQTSLIQCWMDELAQIRRQGYLEAVT